MASSPNSEKAADYDAVVPFTARMMAAARARESARPDALFCDPFAAQLAGAPGFAAVEQKLSEKDLAYIALRTHLFDRWLLSSTADQVVILAAGLDTRAYRLAFTAGVKLFELDFPQVLDYKAEQLQWVRPTCERHALGVDLTQPWQQRLLAAGFNPDRPSSWLLEGLLMYLLPDQVRGLLATVSELAAPNSQLSLDVINPLGVDHAAYRGYFQSGWEQPEALLSDYGWQGQVLQPGDPEARFHRYTWPSTPRHVPNVARAFLVRAQRVFPAPLPDSRHPSQRSHYGD